MALQRVVVASATMLSMMSVMMVLLFLPIPAQCDDDVLNESTPSSKGVFLIVTKADNALSLSVSRQLYPATVYFLCPPSSKNKRFQDKKYSHCRILPFNPFGTIQEIRTSAQKCLATIQQECRSSNGKNLEESDDSGTSMHLVGVLFNPYGYIDSDRNTANVASAADKDSNLLPLTRYKLISTAIVIDVLAKAAASNTAGRQSKLSPRQRDGSQIQNTSTEPRSDSHFYSSNMRIIAVGTEAARGLPKMGFPVPNLGPAKEESLQDILTGEAFCNKSTATSTATNTAVSWEHVYAHLSAVLVLYFKALAANAMSTTTTQQRRYPRSSRPPTAGWYYSVVSPGMTQESLNVQHVPPSARTLAFRLKMMACRSIFVFPILKRMEIAKTVEEGGRMLVQALRNLNWPYPNGSFVGARSGTGGPVCEQTELEGGKGLGDPHMKQLVYQVVQNNVKSKTGG